MNNIEAARCAAENAVLAHLLRFMISALAARPDALNSSLAKNGATHPVVQALKNMRGEFLAPFSLDLNDGDEPMSRAANEAARAVFEQFERQLRAALTQSAE